MREVLLFLLVFFAIAENPISHVWSKSTQRPPPGGQHSIEVILVPGTEIDVVEKWLRSGGAAYIKPTHQNSILVSITVALLEKLLSVEMYYFESGNETVVRTLDLIVVPDDVQPYIRAILGVNDFPLDRHVRKMTPKRRLLSVDNSDIHEPNVGDEGKSYKLFILIVGIVLPALLLLRSKTTTSNKLADSSVLCGSHVHGSSGQVNEEQSSNSELSFNNMDPPFVGCDENKEKELPATTRTTKKLRKEKRDSRKEEQERQRKEQLRIIQQEVCMRERQRSNKEQATKKECLRRQSTTIKDNESSSSSTPNSKPVKKQKQPKSKSPEQRPNKYQEELPEIKSIELNPVESIDAVASEEEKLPLESSWTISILQYGYPPQLVGTFDTVQGFWKCWNQIPIDRLPINCELAMLPASETEITEVCSGCGRWTASDLPIETRSSLWLQAVLLLIGEQINVGSETKVKGMILRTCSQGDVVSILVQDYNNSYSAILEMQSHLFPGDIGLCFLYEPSEEERRAYEYFYMDTNTADEWIAWNAEFTSNDVGYNDYDYWSYSYYGWYPQDVPPHNGEESYIYASQFENTFS